MSDLGEYKQRRGIASGGEVGGMNFRQWIDLDDKEELGTLTDELVHEVRDNTAVVFDVVDDGDGGKVNTGSDGRGMKSHSNMETRAKERK